VSNPLKARLCRVGGALYAELEPELAGSFREGDALDSVAYGPEGQLLLRPGLSLGGYFAASLTSVPLADVFNHVLSGIRTGKLVVAFGAMRKTVSFRDGQITFATSSEPHERLGSILIRLGLLDRKEMDAAVRQVQPGARLGQVLTRSGRLSAAKLYSAMTFLAREIVLDLFSLTAGDFIFLEGAGMVQEDTLTLPERTRDIVVAGVRRGEEVVRLRKRLSPELLVRRTAVPPPSELEELLRRAAGTVALGELRRHFEGGEYGFLSSVEEALRQGSLQIVGQVGPPPPGQPPDQQSPLQLYRSLVQAICEAMLGSGEGLGSLRSFLESPQPGTEEAFAGVTLSSWGDLDVDRVAKNLERLGPVVGRARTYEALNAFVSYALFSAKNSLSGERASALEARVRAMQRGEGS
jgi:hypothetical protein